MRPVRVTKMSGAGNDFIVLGPADTKRVPGDLAEWVRRVCRRGLSVGADGVIFVDPLGPDVLRVTFMNPDGSAAFCGNGTRCAARFARLNGLAGDRMTLETEVGPVPAWLSGDRVTLVLPPPRDRGAVELDLGETALTGTWVDAGSPHFVAFVPAVGEAPLDRWGPVVRRHPHFGDRGVNVNLVEVGGPGQLLLRTWERGVEGETLACGSGAVATGFVSARDSGIPRIRIVPRSGVALDLEFEGDLNAPTSVTLAGDARVVFEADLSPEATCGF